MRCYRLTRFRYRCLVATLLVYLFTGLSNAQTQCSSIRYQRICCQPVQCCPIRTVVWNACCPTAGRYPITTWSVCPVETRIVLSPEICCSEAIPSITKKSSSINRDLPAITDVPPEPPELILPPALKDVSEQSVLEKGRLLISERTGLSTWTARDGRVCKAKYISMTADTIVLERDNQRYRVPIDFLSESCRSLAKQRLLNDSLGSESSLAATSL